MTPDDAAATAQLTFVVEAHDTARALGSGSLDVLGTPRLLAWCEAATCAVAASRLGTGETTVGTSVRLEHSAAAGVGAEVRVAAVLARVDGRSWRFDVTATAADGRVLGTADITRVVVDVDRFLARLPG